VGYQRDRLGSSGVFKAIVDVSRKIKRRITESDDTELSPEAEDLAHKIAQAFIAGRFTDVYAMGAPNLQQTTPREKFHQSWTDAAEEHRPLTGFRVADHGHIDLAFIPGLEEVPQSQFAAFLEIAFSGIDVPYEDPKAFTVGVVLLDQDGELKIGAIHRR
jgi:hypothetical protein